MCRSIAEAGDSVRRRCPIHRRDSVVAVHVAVKESGLPQQVVEDLFTELRREGRHISVSGLNNDTYEQFITDLTNRVEGDAVEQRYRDILAQRGTDPEPGGDTLFALRRIRGAAVSRSQAINAEITNIANRLNITQTEARNRYNAFREEITSNSDATPLGYNAAAVRNAQENDLPADAASIHALNSLRAAIETNTVENAGPDRLELQRVETVDLNRAGSPFSEASYDPEGGHLSVTFRGETPRTYTYQNVPVEVWDEFSNADRVGAYYSTNIRGNSSYQYEDVTAATQAAQTVNCANCGRFVPNDGTHSCPERELIEALVANGINNGEAVAIAHDADDVEEALNAVLGRDEENTETSETTNDDSIENDETPENNNEASGYAVIPVSKRLNDELEILEADQACTEYTLEENQTHDNYLDEHAYTLPLLPGGYPDYYQDTTVSSFINYVSGDGIGEELAHAGINLNHQMVYRVIKKSDHPDFDEIPGYLRAGSRGDQKLVPVLVYDGDKYFLKSETYRVPEEGYRYIQKIVSRGKQYDLNTYSIDNDMVFDNVVNNPDLTEVPERSSEDQAAAWREALAVRDAAESFSTVTQRSTFDRDYNVDAFASDGKVKWAGVRDIRKIESEGITVSSDVLFVGTFKSFDSEGHSLKTSSWTREYSITGKIAVGKEGDEFVTKSHVRQLKCSCIVYQRRYDCAHVRTFHKNFASSVKQKALAPSATTTRVERQRGELPPLLATRSDVRVVANEGTEGRDFSTTTFTTGLYYNNYRSTTPSFAYTTEEAREDPMVMHDAVTLGVISNRSYYNGQVSHPPIRAIRSALTVSDSVEVPIDLRTPSINNGYDAGQVTGTIILSNTENGVSVNGRLRCRCGRFVSADDANGTCPHIEALERRAVSMLTDTRVHSSRFSPRDNLLSTANEIGLSTLDEIYGAYEQELMARELLSTEGNGIDTLEQAREEVPARYEEIMAARRAEAERIAAEQAEQERLYREERAEWERQRAERRARENRVAHENQIEYFRRNEPAVVAGLESYRQTLKSRWDENKAPVEYSNNPERVKAEMEELKEKPLEAVNEGVTFGICDPNVEGSRRFGVEIEFDIKNGVNTSEAIRKIGQELYEAGLTSNRSQGRYHSGRASGYQNWTLESDCTVAGEIVSPIMSDSPEYWEQLATVCEIVKRNGGVATARTGSHVHVSSASFYNSAPKKAEVLRTAEQFGDILYRASTNPSKREHRGMSWCSPNQGISGEISEPAHNIGHHSSHHYGINMESAESISKSANIELRMWDGSLDPAVIQQQVALSTAIVDYAEHRVEDQDGKSIPRDETELRGLGYYNGSSTESEESLSHIGHFLDEVIPTSEGRKRMLALLSKNKWQDRY